MKRAIAVVSGLVVALAIAPLFWPELGSARAQSGCKSFEAIAQARNPSSTPLVGIVNRWGGPLYVKLEGEWLVGVLSGYDGSRHQQPAVGQARGGSYTMGFNCITLGTADCTGPEVTAPPRVCADTITFEVPVSVFSPPAPVFGYFHGNTARIIEGTGRFAGAWGNLNFSGPFIVYPEPDPSLGRPYTGRFNAELSGNICGIE